MQTTQKRPRSESPSRRDKRRSAPPSGAQSPPIDTGDRGAEAYDDLFGTPALAGDPDPFEGDAGDPPAAPSLPFTAYPPKRELYEAAFRAAYKYPDALMLVMEGVRKGLKRGKEAAQRAGGQSA
jgi:hypothetical protein